MLAASSVTTIGALNIRMIGATAVTTIQADEYASTRLQFEILYASAK
jgi:hypothetical protein